MDYYVAKNGCDQNNGSAENPFLTISKAASIAQPGDMVNVREGVYREWVNPVNSGEENNRITYQAVPGKKVIITGSESVTDWQDEGNNVWKATIPNSLFGDYNPYKEIIYGDWLFSKDRVFHTGEVYLNGKSMYEMADIDGVKNPVISETSCDPSGSIYTWYCEVGDDDTVIWANFQGADPRENDIEINVRQFCFWPEETLRSYITVRGFVMKQAATQWAPPTALQNGLIGPHWSKGWIIEDNIISDSKCVGISIGKDISTGDNEWSRLKFKQGTQREREVIFRATHGNWNKETIGSHIIRNNTIFNCEQAGVVGHLGGAFCTIDNNHIYNIHHKRQFHGAEIAGIKLHAALDTKISSNYIHNAYRGVWLDWQAQGTNLTRNVFYDNSSEDFFVEVSHGPYTADHNIFLSPWNYRDMSQGGAFVHNLFTGKFAARSDLHRFTPYHFPHETDVAGVMTIMGGDHRFYNNVFLRGEGDDGEPKTLNFWSGAPIVDGVPGNVTFTQSAVGLGGYDEYPNKDEKPWEMPPGTGPMMLDSVKLPVYVAHNLYLNNGQPYKKEENAIVRDEAGMEFSIDREQQVITISITKPELLQSDVTELVTTEVLGMGFQAEMNFENTDGTPFKFDRDFFGGDRLQGFTPGPFQISESQSVPLVFTLKYR